MGNLYDSITISFYKGNALYSSGENTINYRSLGNYDFISLNSITGTNTLSKMFKSKILSQFECEYDSLHTFFAVFNDKYNKDKISADFFKKDKTLYMFVSFIQFNYNNQKKSSEQYKEYINRIKFELKNEKYLIYNSLDCCDIILFLKSKNYNDGSRLIQQLDSKEYLKYSYSILALDFSKFDTNEYTEIIDKITICGVIDDYYKFEQWHSELIEKFPTADSIIRYGRLGNEDVILNILHCDASDFFKCFSEENGLLNLNNELFNEALISPRMHFDNFYEELNVNKIDSKPVCLDLKLRFFEACKCAKKNGLILDESIKKAAIEVLNSCDYLSKRNFALDIRDCINSSIELFFEKVKNYRINGPCNNMTEYNESIKRYITGIMSIVNGSLQADRMFFQVPGFNAVLYEIPSKLIIFYTAYVNRISKILDDLNSTYGFIVCPDLYQFTYISMLFPEEYTESNLLLKVRIPVDSLFKPKKLIMELTHEVAHYIGKAIRNRFERYFCEAQILSKEIFESLFENDDDKIVEQTIGKIAEPDKFKTNVTNIIYDNLKKFVSDYFNENKAENINKYRYHQEYLNEAFYDACTEVVISPAIFESIIHEININFVNDIDRNFIFDNALNFKRAIDYNRNTLKENIFQIIDQLNLLVKESYADLIMILTLDIDLEEYVLSFFEPAFYRFDSPKKILYNDVIGERICSVLRTFDKKVTLLDFTQEYSFNDIKKSKLDEFLQELKCFNRESDGIITAFSNYSIEKISEYLKKCKKAFDDKGYNLDDIRNLYRNVIDSDIFKCINQIINFNYEFRDSMFFTSE